MTGGKVHKTIANVNLKRQCRHNFTNAEQHAYNNRRVMFGGIANDGQHDNSNKQFVDNERQVPSNRPHQ